MTGKMKVALGMLVLLVLSAIAFADGDDDRRGDRDDGYYAYNHENREQNRFYRQGVRDGREDREHGRGYFIRERRWDDGGDRDAYIDGYRTGFGAAVYGYRDGGYLNYRAQAYNFGFADGLRIGAQDATGGHSFRPTHGDRYDDAARGYDPSFGNKQDYKSAYRSGYLAGYQRGYRQR